MNNILKSNEIDPLEVLQIIWEGKWILTVIYTIFFASVLVAMRLMPSPSFIATTEFNPIPLEQADLYRSFNSVGVFTISANNISIDIDKGEDKNSIKTLEEVPSTFLLETYFQFLARGKAFHEGIKKIWFIKSKRLR